MPTITGTKNFDELTIAANGEVFTVNLGAALTINSDNCWAQTGKVPGQLDNYGAVLIDGRDVWWIPFDAASGTVPRLKPRVYAAQPKAHPLGRCFRLAKRSLLGRLHRAPPRLAAIRDEMKARTSLSGHTLARPTLIGRPTSPRDTRVSQVVRPTPVKSRICGRRSRRSACALAPWAPLGTGCIRQCSFGSYDGHISARHPLEWTPEARKSSGLSSWAARPDRCNYPNGPRSLFPALRFGLDVAGLLAAGDTIAGVTIAEQTGVTASAATVTSTVVSCRVAGGSAGETGAVTLRWTTAQGDIDERTMLFRLVDR